MPKRKQFFILTIGFLILGLFAFPEIASADGNIWHVATSGNDESGNGTTELPWKTIQGAISKDAVTNGDTVIVHDGTYTENVNVTKSLIIKSENGYANTTVVAADANDYVFEVTASSVTIGGEDCGFTIYGATGEDKSGILLDITVTGCTIQGNCCGFDYNHKNKYGILLYYSNTNTISGNTCISNTVGITLLMSSNNTISGNTSNSNDCGINLTFSEDNIISHNTCNSNSEYGIFLNNSSYNTTYLNNLSSNSSGNSYDVGTSSTGNTWYSPTPLFYHYTGDDYHKNHLGNYYSDYGGSDGDGDGIGSTAYSKSGMTDGYPLMATSDHYSLQAWWLSGDSQMYRDDLTKAPDSVIINGGNSQIWIADQATIADVSFSSTGSWTGQIVFTSAPASGETFTVEIGFWDGSDFTAGGPDATIIGTGTDSVFTYTTDASGFMVPTGNYLALRITNSSGSDYAVQTGGAWSYCSAPDESQDYSLPVELTSFTATPGNGIITLSWLTESEIENLGFNIYRSTNTNLEFIILNAELIPGAGSSSEKHEYRYVDHDVKSGITYWYKLEDVDYKGKTELHGAISATTLGPKEFCLHPNYPNPFNPVTTISYDLPKDVYVELTVYNMLGEKVTTLVKGNQPAGYYSVEWDGRNSQGRIVSSGMYFLRISAGSYCKTNKMVFVR
ncbi:MAG TPA: NosD domain-containing protein [Candidatus Marinimicrobia bacterium]|nr:NosD domain-containing protein [Candidatus Neomarinimicrobiota bacterium]HRS51767.1 NosD domain-containing protein [Candidatus Neomarinimicrobiota bacterium]HRU93037.1 NosD domain-containing protein [Candidatus Neomarinimicrobiota bacterium]